MPAEHEVTLLFKFSKVFTNFRNPHKDWGSNKSFQTDLSDALDKDEAYKAKPSLTDLLRVTQGSSSSTTTTDNAKRWRTLPGLWLHWPPAR